MRSRTDPSLGNRCSRCWLLRPLCLCSQVPTLAPGVELILVRHRAEAFRSSGTARLLTLAVPGTRVIEFGIDTAQANAELAELLAGDAQATALLFPGGGASATPAPRRLVVPDGTWREARRMLRRLPATWGLPRLTLAPSARAELRLRRTPSAASRSTIEAVADALAQLGERREGAALHQLFAVFAERGLRARGTLGFHRAPAAR